MSLGVYITYLSTSTINLKFWLNWFPNMTSKPTCDKKVTCSNLDHPSNSREILAKYEEVLCCIHTSNIMSSHVKEHVKAYIIYHKTLTINDFGLLGSLTMHSFFIVGHIQHIRL